MGALSDEVDDVVRGRRIAGVAVLPHVQFGWVSPSSVAQQLAPRGDRTRGVGRRGPACSCEGADCDAGFVDFESCEAAYVARCQGVFVTCGGFAGQTCSDDEYCAYQPEEWCGAADASSICLPRPDVCTSDDDPVCGCDGETYSNACEANAAGTGLYAWGACD